MKILSNSSYLALRLSEEEREELQNLRVRNKLLHEDLLTERAQLRVLERNLQHETTRRAELEFSGSKSSINVDRFHKLETKYQELLLLVGTLGYRVEERPATILPERLVLRKVVLKAD